MEMPEPHTQKWWFNRVGLNSLCFFHYFCCNMDFSIHSSMRGLLTSIRFPLCCSVAQLCLTLCDAMDCSTPGFSVHGDFLGKNTGVGCYAFLQGIFPTQGSNTGLPHCRQILYQLSHKGSPRTLEWVAYSFSSRSS